MLTIFGRKKLSAEKVAHLLVNNILETAEKGFPDVAGFINDSPEFSRVPCVDGQDYGKFLMILVAGNFCYMPQFFRDGEEREIMNCAIEKLAPVFDLTPDACEQKIKEYRDFMARINSPSKNPLYAMSKAVFFKYGLNDFQEDYFRTACTPNPIFLKNLDDIMKNFVWDWQVFNDKFKVIPQAA
ncbi:MAG: hypothetical protein SH856_11240 [Flavobacteriales bacterium]|nr:hypothetical protein [Flavobacteriales bacterium]